VCGSLWAFEAESPNISHRVLQTSDSGVEDGMQILLQGTFERRGYQIVHSKNEKDLKQLYHSPSFIQENLQRS
jgi:hypothetical protein